MLATWHWHIEISSKCTLKCPRCARQEVPDTLINTQLNLDFFKKNFTPEFIQHNVEKITFCGDDGDPIYASDFIKVVQYFKSVKPSICIVIVTNGSYKSATWWESLIRHLNDKDEIHFSLDGWDQDSNNIYRINSNWESIMTGVSVSTHSQVFTSWDAIAFKFNETMIDSMISQAKILGFDQFQLTKSTKFGKIYPSYGSDDPLQPSDTYISSTHRFERDITNLSGREHNLDWLTTNVRLFESVVQIDNITPICHIGNKGLYISSTGHFYPCCWVANRYSHNSKWKELSNQFNLHKTDLSTVLANSIWKSSFTAGSIECTMKCSSKNVDKKYSTEW